MTDFDKLKQTLDDLKIVYKTRTAKEEIGLDVDRIGIGTMVTYYDALIRLEEGHGCSSHFDIYFLNGKYQNYGNIEYYQLKINKMEEKIDETQKPQLAISDVCEHDWKCISYISPSGVWMCTKCNKTVG